jgi:hypothetical protein
VHCKRRHRHNRDYVDRPFTNDTEDQPEDRKDRRILRK